MTNGRHDEMAHFWLSYRGAKNNEELNRVLTSHIMLRRLKQDVLNQIPALQRSRISVLPDPKKLKVPPFTCGLESCSLEGLKQRAHMCGTRND